jgi:hypothetical protein
MEEERWVPKHNPWLIAIVVSMATFMEVLDFDVVSSLECCRPADGRVFLDADRA